MPRKVNLEKTSVAYFDHPDLVPEPGFYALEGEPEVDENGVKHESNMSPGDRVYPSPDGEGFVTNPPDEASEEGGEEE